ncbi:unnamed protein product [Schistosoma mattheei]|uniref:Uncharacterized protein n=1 Tax=Schistosoma mattheei TaxID=31246 RepID=A0A183PLH9_9TREM|nr:unnamed protein product [Schistosoma mattheei]
MLSKQAQNALIGWESRGPKIIKASFKTKKEDISMNVIQCYAPTNDYNEDAEDQRGTESRPSGNCKDTPHSLQSDLG